MSETVTVGFIVSSLCVGGAERHTLQLFSNLPAGRFRTALVYLKREESLLAEADLAPGSIWCADFRKGWDFAGLRRLTDWIKNLKPAVLVCVNTYPLFYGHLARWLARQSCQVVEIFHSTELSASGHVKMRLLYRNFFNRSDRIVYVSNAQRGYWEKRGLRNDRGIVIHNGINVEHFVDWFSPEEKVAIRRHFGFSGGDFVVGICAAMRPEKRHEDLIEAIAQLKAEGLSCKCLIIGDGPRRAVIEQKGASLGLNSDMAITGFQSDVRSFVAACDCMAIVSHQIETFSIAALESMAMGKPMVMSAIGGAAEQVRDSENGYLFPAGDVPALVAALRKLADPARCAQLGRAARVIVERDFGLDGMLEKYMKVFGLD